MNNYPLTLFYDASCRLCQLEIDNLRHRDSENRLVFVDVSVSDFDATPYHSTQAEMMRIIHAQKPDGSVVKGVEVFRLAYAAIGLAWLTAATGWPIFKPLFDKAYLLLANNRYRLSGKFSGLIFHLAAQRAMRRSGACKDGLCDSPERHPS